MIWDTVYKYFKMLLWILIGLNVVTKVHGYSNGYFPDSCGNMFVDHKSRGGVQYEPQNTELPFTMIFNYSQKGDPINVTLQGKPSAKFTGFMLEAWTSGTDHPVGSFTFHDSDKTKIRLLECRNIPGQAVSQRNNKEKTSIQVIWTAGGQDITDINFRVTFVESFSRFWSVKNFNVTLPSPTTPSPTPSATMPITTTETTMPSTTIKTTMPSTTIETTMPSTTIGTTMSSTTRGTTMPSTTTETTMPSTTRGTTMPSTTIGTAMPSTTRDTTMPSTAVSTTTSSSTSEPDSNTINLTTAGPSMTTQRPVFFHLLMGAGTSVMNFRSVVVLLKMELPTILMTMTTLVNSLCSHHPNKVLKISCCLLCAAIEISALVLFFLAEPIKVTLLVLVCVTIVLNFVELVIVCLPIGPSHELKEISDLIVEVCSVIHSIFTIAVVVVGVLDNNNCGKNRKDSWPVKVMIAFTVWMVLFVIWVIIRTILRKTILGRNKTGSLKSSASWMRQRKKKKPSAAEKIFSAVSALFFFGATCFAVALTVGIFRCQEK